MTKSLTKLIRILLLVLLIFPTLSSSFSIKGYADEIVVPDPGSVYNDLPDSYGILGIASQFHIFAKGKTTLAAHTNGNVASSVFEGEVNFDTNIHEGLVSNEIDYLEHVESISSSSEVPDTATRKTKFVVGADNQFSSIDNGNGIALNGTKLDHLKNADIFQNNKMKYIDFSSEFNKIALASDQLYAQKPNLTVTNESFDDVNKRVIDLASQTSSTVFVNIDAGVLAVNTDLSINNPDHKIIVMNVVNIQKNLDIASKIVYNGRSNNETEDFSDANISWNFGNDSHIITINAPFQGTVLAPNSQIEVNQNLDGSIIATDVTIKAEMHRWDPNPINLNSSVILTKVDSSDTTKTLSGAEFSLYAENGSLIKSGLITGKNGTLRYDNLENGDYYFVETKAPEGYQLDKNKHPFTINTNETTKAQTVTVSDKPNLGEVILKKVDSSDATKTLAGAEFSLYAENGTLIKAGLKTNKEGILEYDHLANGVDYFVETKAPDGYQLDKTRHLLLWSSRFDTNG